MKEKWYILFFLSDDYKVNREQLYVLFPGPISDAIKNYKGGVPNCQTRRLQMEAHTKFVFSYLGIDPMASPFYKDYCNIQARSGYNIARATAANRILINFPSTIDSEEPHYYDIEKMITILPEDTIQDEDIHIPHVTVTKPNLVTVTKPNHVADLTSIAQTPMTQTSEASDFDNTTIPSPLAQGFYTFSDSFCFS